MIFFVLGCMVAMLLAFSVIEAAIRVAGVRNQARQAELLWILSIAMKSGRPLELELEAYAKGTWGIRRQKLRALAERLREGVPLTEIIVPQGLLPRSATMQLHAGLNSQSLQDSLNNTASRVTRDLVDDRESGFPGTSLLYPTVLFPITFLIVGFLMYWIIPKFKKIFDDFNTELPQITVTLIKLSDSVVNYWYIFGLPFMYVPLAVFLFVLFSEYYGWRVMTQSFLGRWFIRWHSPDLFRALSQSIAHGVTMDQSLAPLVRYAKPYHFRSRLALAADLMTSGEGSWKSLYRVGLLTFRETALLESAERIGNLPWTLETLASNLERNWVFRLKTVLEFVQPMMLIVMAAMIGFVALAMFMPLIKLLNDLS